LVELPPSVSSVAVTVNEVIADPFELPGVHEREADASEGLAMICVAGEGSPAGVTGDEASEAWLLPIPLAAVTLNV
jgi:hypothetical protein